MPLCGSPDAFAIEAPHFARGSKTAPLSKELQSGGKKSKGLP